MIKFKKLLEKHNVSLRHIFSDYVSDGAISLKKHDFLEVFNKIVFYGHVNTSKFIKSFATDIFNKYSNDQIEIDISTFFKLFEPRKNFVFIIPSYNNIDNYVINMESIRRQVYSPIQVRIIYISDGSNDGTDEAVTKYIRNNKLDNRTEFLRTERRQRQGMVRFTAFHKCFDDEICINLDGDDWLYDRFVLDRLDKHFVSKDLMVSYGSYYCYDRRSVHIGKIMNYPYNDRLIGTSQFSTSTKDTKMFKHCPWISTHLRSAYAKLFKSIELRHFIDNEGNFFQMVTDGCEMYPVLEMSRTKNENIMTPMLIYNKYNSELYDTSYYKRNKPSNKQNIDYREKVTNIIKSRNTYPDMIGPICLEHIEMMFIEINIDDFKKTPIPQLINDLKSYTSYDYVFLNNSIDVDKNVTNNAIELIKTIYRSQPGAVLIESIKKEEHKKASLEIFKNKVKKSYYAIRMFVDLFFITAHDAITIDFSNDNSKYGSIINPPNKMVIDLSKLVPGFYNKNKLIELMLNKKEMYDEVVLQRML